MTLDRVRSGLHGELQKGLETTAELTLPRWGWERYSRTLSGSLVGFSFFVSLTLTKFLSFHQSSNLSFLAPSDHALTQNRTQEHAVRTATAAVYISPLPSLASHVDKVQTIKSVFAERDTIKRELDRVFFDTSSRSLPPLKNGLPSLNNWRLHAKNGGRMSRQWIPTSAPQLPSLTTELPA